MTPGSEADGSDNTLKLILAWALVGIPLVWGVWNTLMAALKLFS